MGTKTTYTQRVIDSLRETVKKYGPLLGDRDSVPKIIVNMFDERSSFPLEVMLLGDRRFRSRRELRIIVERAERKIENILRARETHNILGNLVAGWYA